MRISDWSSDVCSSDLRYDHVIFGGVVKRRGLTAESHQPVRLSGHDGNHNRNFVPHLHLALDARGDIPDALDPGHRGAAELHQDTSHWVDRKRTRLNSSH